jgi:hypothetical protein
MTEPSFFPSVIIGYHGCDRRVADAVLAGRTSLKASSNSYDWLGSGVYFWEGDPSRAIEWAANSKRPTKKFLPAVLGAIIDPGNCLNLLELFYVRRVREAYGQLVRLAETTGTRLPQNKAVRGLSGHPLRYLDCAIINVCRDLQIAQNEAPFDTVRAGFLEGDPIYPTAGFRDRNHIQICVVNPACIKGYFRPIEDEP